MVTNTYFFSGVLSATERLERDFIPILCLSIITIFLGIYADYLSSIFYAKYGPFFDSVAYHNHMAYFLGESAARGSRAGFWSAVQSSTTVLPWLELLPFASVVEPTRSLSIWLQLPWVLALAISAYFYFHKTVGYSRVLAIASTLPLIFIEGIFYFNGGLSDFRIDLLAYLTFGVCCITYLIARSSNGYIAWGVWGFFLGAAILGRPPLIVYFTLIFGLFFIVDFAHNRSLLSHYLLGAAIAFICAGWFLILQRDYLYYYYVVWNADANASLPISESVKHLTFVQKSIGNFVIIYLCMMLAYQVASRLAERWSLGSARGFVLDINWRPLWCAAVPVGYLVLTGKGLNPFVSMVSVAGTVVFLCAPFRHATGKQSIEASWIALALAVFFSGYTASAGIKMHSDDAIVSQWIPRRESLDRLAQAIDTVFENRYQVAPLRYEIAYTGTLSSSTLENVLIYDHDWHFVPGNRGAVAKGNLIFEQRNMFGKFMDNKDAASAWQQVPGQSDGERLHNLAETLLRDVDLIFVPSAGSDLPQHILINRYSAKLADELRSSKCITVIIDGLKVSKGEAVTVLKNLRRAAGNDESCS